MDIYRTTVENFRSPARQVLCLMSDLHLDASAHDRDLLLHDLEAARRLQARISINGDVFDGILPSDQKRYHAAVSTAQRGRDDLINQMVTEAVELLRPYADLIDVISPGNHERSVLKYHHVDLTSMIVWALNQVRSPDLPAIHQGAYRGFQQYCFRWDGRNGAVLFTIYRHHGRGGSSPVTGGALDLDRIRKDFEADLYWIGHKHQSIQRKFTRVSLGSKGRLAIKPQRAVMSAGYTRQVVDEDPFADGDIVDFGETFYNVSEAGAQWVLIEAQSSGESSGTGYVNGLRWSVSDSPAQLMQAETEEATA